MSQQPGLDGEAVAVMTLDRPGSRHACRRHVRRVAHAMDDGRINREIRVVVTMKVAQNLGR
jgi:1,4-dihydroxy-2-naphthoyl-CoA synthase